MKRSTKPIASFLLAAMLLSGCAAGSSDPPETSGVVDTTVAADVTTPEETLDPNARANHFDALPEDLNFNGATVNGLFRGALAHMDGTQGHFFVVNDAVGTNNVGDSVSDAVWQRNIDVAERLNINLVWTPTDAGALGATQTFIRQVVMAADDTYSFILSTGNTTSQCGLTDYMRDVSNIPYVDWESPWWWQFANDALSLDGKTMQFAVGDMLLTNLGQTCVMFFNKELYEAQYGDPDQMYQTVLDGKFTIDRLNEMVAGAYKDVNGDGTPNDGDIFGLLWSATTEEETLGYIAAVDLDLYTRDADGKLLITMNNERTVTAIEKLNALQRQNVGSRIGVGAIAEQAKPFSEGSSMFFGARLISTTETDLREMEQEYGITPMPKLDEDQEMYLAGVHNSGTSLCVPKTTVDKNFEIVGATWEALCGEAHRKYIDIFLETALKLKYSRDALSGQCIDLVVAGLTKNTLDEYSNFTNNIIITALLNPIRSNPGTFASTIERLGTNAQKKWDKSIANLNLGAE